MRIALTSLLTMATLTGCSSDETSSRSTNDDPSPGGGGTTTEAPELDAAALPPPPPADAQCFLETTLGRAIAWEFPCGGASTRLDWGTSPDPRVELHIPDLAEGVLGRFAARLVYKEGESGSSTEQVWTSEGCGVELVRFELDEETAAGRGYRIGGMGLCPEPAFGEGPAEGPPFDVGPLRFVSGALFSP